MHACNPNPGHNPAIIGYQQRCGRARGRVQGKLLKSLGNDGVNRGIGLATALLALALAVPVGAQENLDLGKTGAQLFAANCALCHKSPRPEQVRRPGLSGFLREHYTSSRESATVIATYLESLGPAPGKRGGRDQARRQGQTSGRQTSEPKIERKIEPQEQSQARVEDGRPKSGEGETGASQRRRRPNLPRLSRPPNRTSRTKSDYASRRE